MEVLFNSLSQGKISQDMVGKLYDRYVLVMDDSINSENNIAVYSVYNLARSKSFRKSVKQTKEIRKIQKENFDLDRINRNRKKLGLMEYNKEYEMLDWMKKNRFFIFI